MKQISIFDILEPIKTEIPCGYIDNIALIGRELRFNELQTMINEKCLIAMPRAGAIDYKVVKIMGYWKDCDKVYKRVRKLPENCLHYGERVNEYVHDICGQKEAMVCYEEEYTCDRVGYTDSERCKTSNSWVSEMYCSNGRYKPITDYAESFYELIML